MQRARELLNLHGKFYVLKNDRALNRLLGAGIDDLKREKKKKRVKSLQS